MKPTYPTDYMHKGGPIVIALNSRGDRYCLYIKMEDHLCYYSGIKPEGSVESLKRSLDKYKGSQVFKPKVKLTKSINMLKNKQANRKE